MKKLILLLALIIGNAQAIPLWMINGPRTSAAVTIVGSYAPSNIVLSATAARTSGVAPLAVFFDASGTTDAAVTAYPFHDLEYRWNFGDATAGTWAYGRDTTLSKNIAMGAVAAHVFETPGDYTVSVSAFDGTNTAATTIGIHVDDPDVVFSGTNTICVTNGTDYTGCPTGATHVGSTADFTAAITTYAQTGKRVLFKRGDTFIPATPAILNQPGPGTIGAFGTGALPVVQDTTIAGSRPMISTGASHSNDLTDWRIMDLDLDGMGRLNTLAIGVDPTIIGGISRLLVLRVTSRRFSSSFGFATDGLNYYNNTPTPDSHALKIDQIFIVDSQTIPGANTSYAVYSSGQRFALLGNSFDNGGNYWIYDENGARDGTNMGSHMLRFLYLGKAVISNNTSTNPGYDRLHIKLNGPTWINGAPAQGDITNIWAGYFKSGTAYTITDVGTTDWQSIDSTYTLGKTYSVGTGFTANASGSGTGRADRVLGALNFASYSSAATTGDGITNHVIISDNKYFEWLGPWVLGISPVDGSSYQIDRDIIIERNLQIATATSQSSYHICAQQVTIRNNVTTDGGLHLADVSLYGAEPPSTNVWVYNNSMYSPNAVSYMRMVHVSDATVSYVKAYNNVMYAPNGTSPTAFHSVSTNNILSGNNSTDSQVKNTNPFTTVPPVNSVDFTPTGYPIGAGYAVPVWSDLFRTLRTLPNDMGAVIH